MAKIQNIGVGRYIRNPRGIAWSSDVPISKVLRIDRDDGNGFLCFPVKDAKTVPVTLDREHYQFIPIDTNVEEVTI